MRKKVFRSILATVMVLQLGPGSSQAFDGMADSMAAQAPQQQEVPGNSQENAQLPLASDVKPAADSNSIGFPQLWDDHSISPAEDESQSTPKPKTLSQEELKEILSQFQPGQKIKIDYIDQNGSQGSMSGVVSQIGLNVRDEDGNGTHVTVIFENLSAGEPQYLTIYPDPDQKVEDRTGSPGNVQVLSVSIDKGEAVYNLPPILNANGKNLDGLELPEGFKLNMPLSRYFSDPEDAPLSFSLDSAPPDFELKDGLLLGTIKGPVGTGYEFKIIVKDSFGNELKNIFKIYVTQNKPPFKKEGGLKLDEFSVSEGDSFELSLNYNFGDPEGEKLQFHLDEAPDTFKLSIDGKFSGNAPMTPDKTHEIKFTVIDEAGNKLQSSFLLEVLESRETRLRKRFEKEVFGRDISIEKSAGEAVLINLQEAFEGLNGFQNLEFKASELPDGLELYERHIVGQLDMEAQAKYEIEVSVGNDKLGWVKTSIKLNVNGQGDIRDYLRNSDINSQNLLELAKKNLRKEAAEAARIFSDAALKITKIPYNLKEFNCDSFASCAFLAHREEFYIYKYVWSIKLAPRPEIEAIKTTLSNIGFLSGAIENLNKLDYVTHAVNIVWLGRTSTGNAQFDMYGIYEPQSSFEHFFVVPASDKDLKEVPLDDFLAYIKKSNFSQGLNFEPDPDYIPQITTDASLHPKNYEGHDFLKVLGLALQYLDYEQFEAIRDGIFEFEPPKK